MSLEIFTKSTTLPRQTLARLSFALTNTLFFLSPPEITQSNQNQENLHNKVNNQLQNQNSNRTNKPKNINKISSSHNRSQLLQSPAVNLITNNLPQSQTQTKSDLVSKPNQFATSQSATRANRKDDLELTKNLPPQAQSPQPFLKQLLGVVV